MGADVKQRRIRPAQRIGQRRAGIRVTALGGIDPAAGILGKACRAARGDARRLIEVGDGDGNRPCRAAQAAIGGGDGDVIDIVVPGIGRRLEIRRRLEGHVARAGIDTEQPSIHAAQRKTQGAAGIRITSGGGIDGAGGILAQADRSARGDARCLIDIGEGDGDGPGRAAEQAIGGGDGDIIDVVRAIIGRGFEIGRCLEGESTRAGIDVEQAGIGATQREGQGGARVSIAAGGGIDGAGGILGEAGRTARGDVRRIIGIGHRDGDGLGRAAFGPIRGGDGDVIDIIRPVIGRGLVIGRCDEGNGTGGGIDIEQGGIGAAQRKCQGSADVGVGAGDGIGGADAVFGKACRGTRGDAGRLIGRLDAVGARGPIGDSDSGAANGEDPLGAVVDEGIGVAVKINYVGAGP